MSATETTTTTRQVARPRRNYEMVAWSWMRYSGFLLIILAFLHVILQDVVTGPHMMDLTYVARRWASLGWRVFDMLLLVFAFAHGMNGLRQVMLDYVHDDVSRKVLSWVLFAIWLIVSIIGAIAIVGGVRRPEM